MIIFLLILCVLGFAYTNVFGRKVWHKCCMVIFGLGFLASLSLIVLNDKDHFGMTEVTQDIKKEGTETVGKKNDGCYDGESINVPRRTSETHRTIYQRVSTRIDSENS